MKIKERVGYKMEYTIGQAAKKANLTTHTLRYYDKEGLLPFLKRSKNGVRKFSDNDMEWLGLVCCLKNTGMPVRQIKEFVRLSMRGDDTLKTRCDMLAEHRDNVEEQMKIMEKHLQKVTSKIEHFTARYEEYINSKAKAVN